MSLRGNGNHKKAEEIRIQQKYTIGTNLDMAVERNKSEKMRKRRGMDL